MFKSDFMKGCDSHTHTQTQPSIVKDIDILEPRTRTHALTLPHVGQSSSIFFGDIPPPPYFGTCMKQGETRFSIKNPFISIPNKSESLFWTDRSQIQEYRCRQMYRLNKN